MNNIQGNMSKRVLRDRSKLKAPKQYVPASWSDEQERFDPNSYDDVCMDTDEDEREQIDAECVEELAGFIVDSDDDDEEQEVPDDEEEEEDATFTSETEDEESEEEEGDESEWETETEEDEDDWDESDDDDHYQLGERYYNQALLRPADFV